MDNEIIDPEIVKPFLDDYSLWTGLPIGLYEKERATFSALSRGAFSGFCEKFRELPGCYEACELDHHKRALATSSVKQLPRICHAGLWNIGYPIIVDGDLVATLLCGQRLLLGREEKSKHTFLKRANKLGLDQRKIDELLPLLMTTPKIAASDFTGELFQHLQKIGQYIFRLAVHGSRLSKQMESLEKRITVLAHEFLLPMQAIVADASNLNSEVEKGASCDYEYAKNAAEEILGEMRRLYVLAENMRSSFLIKREYPSVYTIHSLYRPLIKCWETYDSEARAKGVTLRKPIATSQDFPEIEMSLPDLERAFMNLVGNAVKYSYRGAEERDRYIDIICSHDYPYCTVSIRNFGVGILLEEISSGGIFKAGYRGKLSQDRSRIGSGLGLYEARRIIEEIHHGSIEIESHNRISGYKTTVTAKLPFRQPRKGEQGEK